MQLFGELQLVVVHQFVIDDDQQRFACAERLQTTSCPWAEKQDLYSQLQLKPVCFIRDFPSRGFTLSPAAYLIFFKQVWSRLQFSLFSCINLLIRGEVCRGMCAAGLQCSLQSWSVTVENRVQHLVNLLMMLQSFQEKLGEWFILSFYLWMWLVFNLSLYARTTL